MGVPILYLSYLGGLGGGESSLLSYMLALDRTRFTPRVICGTPGAFVDELRAHGIPADIIPFALPYFKRGFLPTATPNFFPQLYRDLRARHIKLIHCNLLETLYYAAPIAKLMHIPVVWTAHAWWEAEPGWKSTFQEKFLTHIITPTQHIRDCLIATNANLTKRISVIPFGVDTQEFSPGARDESLLQELNLPLDAPIVTLLARFQSVKGHEVLLDAAPKILDAFPNTRFLFVGDTVFDTRDANVTREKIIERVNADARLQRAITFAGFRRDIPRVLRATDILVCPSWFETFGMSNVEAMACGVPVVSTNVGGPAETIVDGETGILVPPREPAVLAARVCELLGDEASRKRMGDKGRRRILEKYDFRRSVEQWEGVYEMALNGAGHPSPLTPSPSGRGEK